MPAANSTNISTIQILRSYSNATPVTLEDGQLAFSFVSNTLYIGSNTGGVIAISDQATANLARDLANTKVDRAGDTMTGILKFGSDELKIGQVSDAGAIDIFANTGQLWAQLNYANTNFIYVDGVGSYVYNGTGTPSELNLESGQILLRTNGKNLLFNSNGTLAVPGPISGLGESKLDFTTYGPNTAYLTTTNDDSTALFMGAGSAELYADTSVQIRANTKGTSQNWTFGAEGTLTFPDNTIQTTAYVPNDEVDNVAREIANSAYSHANGAFIKANAAFDSVNVEIAVNNTQNTRLTVIENTDLSQNVSINTQNSFITIIQGVDLTQNAAIAATDNKMQSAYAHANNANITAKAAYDNSNTKLSLFGGTITGNLVVSQDLSVTGNLFVAGNVTSVNVSSFTVADPLIVLATGNYFTDTKDIGFAGHYNNGTNAHTGLVRDSTIKEWIFFEGYTPELDANNDINIADPSFAYANVYANWFKGNLIAQTARVNGLDVFTFTTAAYNQANVTIGVDTTQNTRLTVIEATDVSQNVSIATQNSFITIIQGVNVDQNNRMTIIEAVNNTQNTRLTVAEATDASQNVRLDFSNTAINATDNKMGAAFNRANTSVSSSGFSANNIIFANGSGFISNSNSLLFISSNNTLITGNIITAGIGGNITNANSIFANTFVATLNVISAGVDLLNYTQAAFNSVNVTIGIDTTQNTRLTVIEATDASQNVRLDFSNTRISLNEAVDASQNVRLDFSNTRISLSEAVDASQNVRLDFSNTAINATDNKMQSGYNQANTGANLAQAAYNQANVTVDIDATQNTRLTVIEATDVSQNVSISTQNNFIAIIQGVDVGQNNRMTIIEAVNNTQNTRLTVAEATNVSQNVRLDFSNTAINATDNKMQSGYNQANTGTDLAQAAYNQANVTVGVDASQNTRLTVIEATDVSQNARITIIEGVNSGQNTLIQTVFNTANTGYNFVTQGGTVTGNVSIFGDLDVTGNISVIGNVTNVVISGNSGQFFGNNTTGFEALYAGIAVGYDFQPQTILQTSGNFDGYAQFNIQNINPGTDASSDIVATADNGSENDTFIDMGIGSSNYSDPANFELHGPNDGYLYVHGNTATGGGNLVFSTRHQNDIIFSANGLNFADEVARFKYDEGLILKRFPLTFADGTKQNTAASPINYTQAAFNTANSASSNTIITQGVDVTQNTRLTVIENTNLSQNVRLDFSNTAINATDNKMQSGYNQANTGTDLAQAAYNQANVTVGVDASQNTRMTVIEGVDASQNVSIATQNSFITIIQGVDVGQNTRLTVIENVNLSQNVRLDFSNTRISLSEAVDVSQNVRLDFSNTAINATDGKMQLAYDQANTGANLAQAAYNQANVTINVDTSQNARMAIIEAVDTTQNTRLTVIENTDLSQNVSIATQNSFITIIQGVDVGQNNRMTIIEGVDLGQNTAIAATDNKMQSGYNQANTGTDLAQAAYNQANVTIGVDATQNTRLTVIEATDVSQNARMAIIEGVDVTQNTNIANRLALTGVANQTVSGNVTFSNDVTVTGNLTVLGNTTSINVNSIEVKDSLITLALGNYTSDALTIGYVGHYNDGTNAHAGMIRDYATKEFYAFQGYTPDTTSNTININDASFTKANINANWFKGNLIATTARVGGLDIGNFASAAFDQANTGANLAQAAYNQANVTIGVDVTQNTRLTVIENTNLSQNVRLDFSNTRISLSEAVDASQNVRLDFSNTAINATDGKMQLAYDQANVTIGVDVTQNTRLTVIENTNLSQNVRLDFSNTAINATDGKMQLAYDQANTGANLAQAAYNQANVTVGVDASQNVRLDFSNTRISLNEAVDDSQNVSIATQNSFITIIQGVDVGQNNRMTIIEGVDATQNTNIIAANTPAGSTTQVQFNDGGIRGASSSLTFDKATGTLSSTLLRSTQSAGDEGGQIDLALAAANTTLTGGVAIDVYQNRLRFFETGGSNRGAYIDLSAANTGVGYNLLSGGGGGGGSGLPTTAFSRIIVSGQPDAIANIANSPLTFVAGSNMTITTDGVSNTITFASTGGGGGGGSTLSNVAPSATYYIGLSANSSGTWTDARVDTNNLFYTTANGTLFVTNYNTSSDYNLKDNIITITDGLDTIEKLRGVSFTWKNSGEKSYGVIAQELEEILPDIVSNAGGHKSVNYNALIGFLIEAVKELSDRVDELEKK